MRCQILMAKPEAISATSPSNNSVKHEKKKRSIIPRLFGLKRNGRSGSSDDLTKSHDNVDPIDQDLDRKIASIRKEYDLGDGPYYSMERELGNNAQSLSLPLFEQRSPPETKEFRVFAATWNVGGKTPHDGLELEDFLQVVEASSDIYVLGFQEIVPLSAGNVLVIEDNEPAAKWLALIDQALNRPNKNEFEDSRNSDNSVSNNSSNKSPTTGSARNFLHMPSLKILSRTFRADSRLLKSCNCPEDLPARERPGRPRKTHTDSDSILSPRYESCVDEFFASLDIPTFDKDSTSYSLVASKQMVGIFLSVWVRSDLIPHVGHLRVSSVGTGIMGCLGNKGCVSISMSLHRTSFCFLCCHLASGEKEGDELKRNADVNEILKSTQFPKVCKNFFRLDPERITDHDRVIWLGDLNYRVSLSYDKAKILLQDNNWETLLEKDQLSIERKERRVLYGFEEGPILFAPTYKYSHNSDSYAGETVKSKKKRRTPAWCDRILWRGNGIEQQSYTRGESRLSDHRPVYSIFSIAVKVSILSNNGFRNAFSCLPHRLDFDDIIPHRHSFYD